MISISDYKAKNKDEIDALEGDIISKYSNNTKKSFKF